MSDGRPHYPTCPRDQDINGECYCYEDQAPTQHPEEPQEREALRALAWLAATARSHDATFAHEANINDCEKIVRAALRGTVSGEEPTPAAGEALERLAQIARTFAPPQYHSEIGGLARALRAPQRASEEQIWRDGFRSGIGVCDETDPGREMENARYEYWRKHFAAAPGETRIEGWGVYDEESGRGAFVTTPGEPEELVEAIEERGPVVTFKRVSFIIHAAPKDGEG